MFTVGSFTGQACSLQWAENTSKGWTSSAGHAGFFVRSFMFSIETGPVSAAETVQPCSCAADNAAGDQEIAQC